MPVADIPSSGYCGVARFARRATRRSARPNLRAPHVWLRYHLGAPMPDAPTATDRRSDPCPRPDQAVRRVHRRRRHRLRRRARRGVRLPRPERRRQDLDDADDRLRLAGHRRRAAGPRAWTRRRDGPQIRARLGVVPQQDTLDTELTVRENLVIYGRYFDLSRAEDARRRADELLEFVQLTERANDQVEPLSGGMKRRLTIARCLINEPDAAAPRRADDRPRPAGPPPALGPPLPAQAARRDARPHDPLHGRGRAAVRPARRHGQGEDRRRGLAARADRAVLDARGRRAALRARASRRRSTASSTGSPSGSSGCPTGCCSTPTTARRPSSAAHAARPPAGDGPRPPVDARGRVPAADRPVADRVMARDRDDAPSPIAPRRHRPGLRAPLAAVPADVPREHLQLVPDPVLFLTAMGLGLGGYVDRVGRRGARRRALPRVPRARACSPRRRCRRPSFEATFPIMGGLNWSDLPRDVRDADHGRATSSSATSSGSPPG